jgi:hypothetical protein
LHFPGPDKSGHAINILPARLERRGGAEANWANLSTFFQAPAPSWNILTMAKSSSAVRKEWLEV